MKKLFLSPITLLVILLLSIAFSCQDEQMPLNASSPYTISIVKDGSIKSEILSRVEGYQRINGRVNIAPDTLPTFPTGYDYDNMVQVEISGTSWVTFIAYKSTGNTSIRKEGISIYYENGHYKNYLKTIWQRATPLSNSYYYTYAIPEGNFDNYIEVDLVKSGNDILSTKFYLHPRSPSQCGQRTMDCIQDMYSNQGWLSVGLTLVSIFEPEVAVGVVGGCMLSCAIGL